jgi:hypothetical protein
MSNDNQELMEAVKLYNKLDTEYRKTREIVAKLFKEAAKTQQVTNLARLTGINRATIYWLMNTWSNNANADDGYNVSKSA